MVGSQGIRDQDIKEDGREEEVRADSCPSPSANATNVEERGISQEIALSPLTK